VEGKRSPGNAETHQSSQVNQFHEKVNNLSVIYSNADCLTNKRSELKAFLSSLIYKPDIIVITEINSKSLVNKMCDSEFSMNGFTLYSKNVGKLNARGILIYCNNSLQSCEVEIVNNFQECLLIRIVQNNSYLYVGAFYRSPNSDANNDFNLCKLVDEICKGFVGNKLLLGDFNFPNINWSQWSVAGSVSSSFNFLSCLRNNLLSQHVTEPTRMRGADIPNVLDLIITDDDFVEDLCYLSPLGKSDHAVLQFSCSLTCPHHNSTIKLNYSKGNYDEFRQFMTRDWSKVLQPFTNINDCWNVFKEIFSEGVDKYIPKLNNMSWKRKSSWKRPITSNLKTLINKKHRLWTRFIETRNSNVGREFRRVRNLVRNETRKLCKKEQLLVAQSCKANQKKFWKFVKEKTNSRSSLGDLKLVDSDGSTSIITEDVDKCNAFADYFSKVYTIEPEGDFCKLQFVESSFPISDLIIDEVDIKNRLDKLKTDKSPGPDCVHPRILHELSGQIACALKLLFELSICSGVLPFDWRCSFISVLHKKGSKCEMANYRPISLTCIVCKILERIVRDHVMNYLLQNTVLSNKQFGFIKGRSTALQLLKVLDIWTSKLEDGGQIDIIYTDFEKAFDKVPHRRLLSKLVAYGISSDLVSWIEGFLCNRFSSVRINGQCSDWKPVISGIPQGTVLGPLLFAIYINDLPTHCNLNSDLFLFADDTKMFKHILCIDDSDALLKDCQKLFDWCEQWLMSLNINKCKVLSIGRRISTDFKYGFIVPSSGFVELDHVDVMQDLGVAIDDDLSFDGHINDKVKKAFQMLGIINRNFSKLDKVSFVLLYKCLVRSQLEYANSVWNPYKSSAVNMLESVQKRATKMVRGCRSMSYEERLRFLKLPTLKYRRLRGDMIEVFKILTGKYDLDLSPTLKLSTNFRTRGNSLKLSVERASYNLRKYSFPVRVVTIWNSLPEFIIKSDSVNSFKNSFDNLWQKREIYYNYKADLTESEEI
jgi:hypothetical protein